MNPDSTRDSLQDSMHTAVRLRTSLSALFRQLRQAGPVEGAQGGIGTARLGVLAALHRRGPMTPTALAAHERVRVQTLTRLLAELEAEGWIAREPHPDDGRQTLLSLARLGARQLSADVQRREASLAQAIESTLTTAQRLALVKACASIDALADALAAQGSAAAGPAVDEARPRRAARSRR